MTQTITNDVSAITPELWSSMVQVPLYKSLVALEVASTRLSDTVQNADTVHVPRFGDLSAATYTPGTQLSAQDQDWIFDTLVVSTYKVVSFYVDDVNRLQTNVDAARELAVEAAFRLKDGIDSDVFKNITGTDGFYTVDELDLGLSSTEGAPVSAGSANIINVFAGARKYLRENNVEEVGDWVAVVTPKIAADIEVKAANVGFNVADATLRNGYAGDWMGFQIFLSNNLPSGNMSALAPAAGSTVSIAAGDGGPSGGNASGTLASRALYIGRKNTIDVVLQRAPTLEIRPADDRLGSYFYTSTVYGSAVFNKNAARGLNLTMEQTFSG